MKLNDQFTETVSGCIVGGDETRRVALVAPNGRVQREASIPLNKCPKEWATEQKNALLSQKCGDGKPLSYHPGLVVQIYGESPEGWAVRIFDN